MCFLHDSLAVVVVSIVFSLMWRRRRRRTGIKSSATSKFRCHPSKRLSAIIIIISFKASQGFMMICRCQKWKIVPLISNAWPPKHSSFKYFHFLITHPCKILSVLIKIYVREEFAHFVENETIKITQLCIYIIIHSCCSREEKCQNSTACSRIKFLSFHPLLCEMVF